MLLSSTRPGSDVRPVHHGKTVSPSAAARLIQSHATVAVEWLSDGVAAELEHGFLEAGQPRDITVVYATAEGAGRSHGLNRLGHPGLVRRVVGGQWHPVARLQALASADQIEAYSLPVGIIHRLFRDIAEGLAGHLSRSGLGTFTDPRNGGGRLNPRTREQLVRLVRPAGDEALLFRSFPIDVALVGVAFMAESGRMAMTREAATIARAAQKCGGTVIAQANRIGTLGRLPAGHVEVPDTLADVLIPAETRERGWETFAPATAITPTQRRLTY